MLLPCRIRLVSMSQLEHTTILGIRNGYYKWFYLIRVQSHNCIWLKNNWTHNSQNCIQLCLILLFWLTILACNYWRLLHCRLLYSYNLGLNTLLLIAVRESMILAMEHMFSVEAMVYSNHEYLCRFICWWSIM